MDKPWLLHYPSGVPADIDTREFASIVEVLQSSCRRYAQLPACRNLGAAISYGELDRGSRDLAAWLQHVAGLRKGDRIALMLPNLLQYPVAMFAALRAGLVAVNVNPLYTPRELEHQLQDSGAIAIVVLENFAHTLEQVIARTPVKTVITTQVGDLFPPLKALLTNLVVKHIKKMVPAWRLPVSTPFPAALRAGRAHVLDAAAPGPDDVAFLQYTGGTTGVAKGAVLTHGNIVANLLQLSAWIARDLEEGRECALIPLPLYHVFALTTGLAFMKIGAQLVLVTNPRELPSLVATLRNHPITAMIGVNTLYNALLNAPGFADIDFSRLKLASAGGMAVQRAVAERWKAVTGVPLVEGYGLSETSPVVTSNRLDIKDWTGTVGLPLPSTEVAILDDKGGAVPAGDIGEVAVRGPQVMRGYWNRPDETAKVFTDGGWLRTGDLGSMDEGGYVRIVDRKKDMIVVSGFKVYPNEVEDVVAMLPGILEVCAIGVPDDRTGEAVKVVAIRKDPELTGEAIIDHCRRHLAAYKTPRQVEFRSEALPKSNIGKILRRALREPAAT